MWLFFKEYAWMIVELSVLVGLMFWKFTLHEDKEFADMLPDGRQTAVSAGAMLVLLEQLLLIRHDIELSGPEYLMCVSGIGIILTLVIGYFQLYNKARLLAIKVRQLELEARQNGNVMLTDMKIQEK